MRKRWVVREDMKSRCYVFAVVLFLGVVSGAMADWLDFSVETVVPDNDPTGLQDTQVLSGYSGYITSVDVRMTLTRVETDLSWCGDYYATLQHDSGFSVLLNRVGRTSTEPLGYGASGFDITLSLAAPDVHLYQTGSPGYDSEGRLIGTWGMDGRNVDPDAVLDTDVRTAMLSSYNGLDANGSWTLFVADMNQNGTAQLESWGLNIVTEAVPEPSTIGLMGGALMLLFVLVRSQIVSSKKGIVLDKRKDPL